MTAPPARTPTPREIPPRRRNPFLGKLADWRKMPWYDSYGCTREAPAVLEDCQIDELIRAGHYKPDSVAEKGSRLRQLRWLLGLSRDDLAKYLGVPIWKIVAFEDGWPDVDLTGDILATRSISSPWLEIGWGSPIREKYAPLAVREFVLETVHGRAARHALGEAVLTEAAAKMFHLPEEAAGK